MILGIDAYHVVGGAVTLLAALIYVPAFISWLHDGPDSVEGGERR